MNILEFDKHMEIISENHCSDIISVTITIVTKSNGEYRFDTKGKKITEFYSHNPDLSGGYLIFYDCPHLKPNKMLPVFFIRTKSIESIFVEDIEDWNIEDWSVDE